MAHSEHSSARQCDTSKNKTEQNCLLCDAPGTVHYLSKTLAGWRSFTTAPLADCAIRLNQGYLLVGKDSSDLNQARLLTIVSWACWWVEWLWVLNTCIITGVAQPRTIATISAHPVPLSLELRAWGKTCMHEAYRNVPPLVASHNATAVSLDKTGTATCIRYRVRFEYAPTCVSLWWPMLIRENLVLRS